jgi:hypothetical protein
MPGLPSVIVPRLAAAETRGKAGDLPMLTGWM